MIDVNWHIFTLLIIVLFIAFVIAINKSADKEAQLIRTCLDAGHTIEQCSKPTFSPNSSDKRKQVDNLLKLRYNTS